jgi:hypothetical protein
MEKSVAEKATPMQHANNASERGAIWKSGILP